MAKLHRSPLKSVNTDSKDSKGVEDGRAEK